MAQHIPKVKFSDGLQVPLLGLGTFGLRETNETQEEHSKAYEAIKNAIKCGYRFLDTATYYHNEEVVGRAVRDCLKEKILQSRDELIICTKVWCNSHKRESVMRECKESLRKLQLDYVDIYLIHWPMGYQEGEALFPVDAATGKVLYSDIHFKETWRGMEDVKDAGLAKSIGLSNFNSKQILEILEMPCKYRPTVNQVECHIYLNQEKLRKFCEEKEIFLHAHCPLGSPGSSCKPGQPVVLEDPLVLQMAQKYQKTPAQIVLKFLVQRNIAPIPKSITAKRIQENIDLNFQFSQDDLAEILNLDKNFRYCANADMDVKDHPFFPFHEEF